MVFLFKNPSQSKKNINERDLQETRRNETKIELVFLANIVPIANKVHGFFCCCFNFTVIDLSKKKKKNASCKSNSNEQVFLLLENEEKKKRSV